MIQHFNYSRNFDYKYKVLDMTLRDKLKPTTSINTQGEAGRFADKSVKVAEDFAIGFVEWFADSTLKVDLDGYKTFGDTDETELHTTKELLEIYKETL